jgi:hypothetical protein
MGSPSLENPHGIEIAGKPAMFHGIVSEANAAPGFMRRPSTST